MRWLLHYIPKRWNVKQSAREEESRGFINILHFGKAPSSSTDSHEIKIQSSAHKQRVIRCHQVKDLHTSSALELRLERCM